MRASTRRQLLTTSTAAALTSTLLVSEVEGEQTRVKPFVVRTEEARGGGPWLVHGEKVFLTKVSGADGNKNYSAIEALAPPGMGPSLHIHLAQNELFYVLHGSVGVQCGSERTILDVGDVYFAPANIPHSYVTLGTEESRLLNVFDPPGDMERFFQELASYINGPPNEEHLASIHANHGMKMVGPGLQASSFTTSKG